ncbi:MAG: polar amino acid transport system substrate-binding protein [Pseudomonadales bacterium]
MQLPFGELKEAVIKGKADLVISGMAITSERTQELTFIGPTIFLASRC